MSKQTVKCSVCKQPMKTAFGSSLNQIGGVTCRRCFGEQSYGGNLKNYSQVAAAQLVTNAVSD